MLTLEQLRKIIPYAGLRAGTFLGPINQAMGEYEINTPERRAAFLAQIAHESGSLRYTCEIASGSAYEGRADLGNTEPGDGVKYKGRGLIQITGRANYAVCGDALGLDLITYPDLLTGPDAAARSAGWFWQKHGLNELADDGNFERITRHINGGLNGWNERRALWEKAKEVLA